MILYGEDDDDGDGDDHVGIYLTGRAVMTTPACRTRGHRPFIASHLKWRLI